MPAAHKPYKKRRLIRRSRSCTTKTRYPDEANARARIAHLLEAGWAGKLKKMYIYHCDFCHGWHGTKSRTQHPPITRHTLYSFVPLRTDA